MGEDEVEVSGERGGVALPGSAGAQTGARTRERTCKRAADGQAGARLTAWLLLDAHSSCTPWWTS
jgi:hypothetical protein